MFLTFLFFLFFSIPRELTFHPTSRQCGAIYSLHVSTRAVILDTARVTYLLLVDRSIQNDTPCTLSY